jgi:hypothetical protein
LTFTIADPISATFTIVQSGLVVSGNTAIVVMEQITSGDTFSSIKVSGLSQSIQIYRGKPSSLMPTLGAGHIGAATDFVSIDVFVRNASYDTSGGNNQAFGIANRLYKDVINTMVSGVWTSGFNLATPKLVSYQQPMPSELNTVGKTVWRFHYLL